MAKSLKEKYGGARVSKTSVTSLDHHSDITQKDIPHFETFPLFART
jgi:hypothetical protein